MVEMWPGIVYCIDIIWEDIHLDWRNWKPFLILVGSSFVILVGFIAL